MHRNRCGGAVALASTACAPSSRSLRPLVSLPVCLESRARRLRHLRCRRCLRRRITAPAARIPNRRCWWGRWPRTTRPALAPHRRPILLCRRCAGALRLPTLRNAMPMSVAIGTVGLTGSVRISTLIAATSLTELSQPRFSDGAPRLRTMITARTLASVMLAVTTRRWCGVTVTRSVAVSACANAILRSGPSFPFGQWSSATTVAPGIS